MSQIKTNLLNIITMLEKDGLTPPEIMSQFCVNLEFYCASYGVSIEEFTGLLDKIRQSYPDALKLVKHNERS